MSGVINFFEARVSKFRLNKLTAVCWSYERADYTVHVHEVIYSFFNNNNFKRCPPESPCKTAGSPKAS